MRDETERLLKHWIDADPDKLEKFSVVHDGWDERFFAKMQDEMPAFTDAQFELAKDVPTADELWADTFWNMWRVEPEQVDQGDMAPSHLLDHVVIDALGGLKNYNRLKDMAEGDDVASAMACLDLAEALSSLWDKFKDRQKRMEEIQELLMQLKAAREGEDGDPDAIMEALMGSGDQLEMDMDGAEALVSSAMGDAIKDAMDQQDALNGQSKTWGRDAAQLSRMSAQERLDLARRLNTPFMRDLFKLMGPMKRIMMDQQWRKMPNARQTVYDTELGANPSLLLPTELVALLDEDTEIDFLRRFTERSLRQVKMRGKERVAKGRVIVALDNSGSMGGARERVGKAVALCLLYLAKEQDRGFHGIHFSNPGHYKEYPFPDPSKFDLSKILDYAEEFMGGGTDFMTPLTVAVENLDNEFETFGKSEGDIVFITDGECSVTSEWMEWWNEKKEKLGFTCWGFLIGHESMGIMDALCGDKVFTVKDLASGNDFKKLFGGV